MDVLDTATTEIMAHRARGNSEDNWQSVVSNLHYAIVGAHRI